MLKEDLSDREEPGQQPGSRLGEASLNGCNGNVPRLVKQQSAEQRPPFPLFGVLAVAGSLHPFYSTAHREMCSRQEAQTVDRIVDVRLEGHQANSVRVWQRWHISSKTADVCTGCLLQSPVHSYMMEDEARSSTRPWLSDPKQGKARRSEHGVP